MARTDTPDLPAHWQPISSGDIADKANTDNSARKLAVRGLPALHESNLSESEAMVIEDTNARISARGADLEAEEAEIRHIVVSAPAGDLAMATLTDDVDNRIIGTFTAVSGVIRDTVQEAEAAEAEHEGFVTRHGFETLPTYKVSKIKHYAALIFVWLIETVFGSSMYLGASQAGWLGAVIAVGAVSGLNVILGGLGGWVFRHCNLIDLPDDPNRRKRGRAWGYPLLTLIVVTLVIVNGLAAHYREVASTAKRFSEAQVMAHAKEAPTDLSLWSLALFLMGLLCALIAAWKVWSASPVPGYEPLHRKMVDTAAAREDLKQSLQGALEGVRASEVDSLWNQRLAVDGQLEDARRRVVALALKHKRAVELTTDDIAAGTQAIARFRRINTTVRSDSVVPLYFGEAPVFRSMMPKTYDDIEAEIDRVSAEHKACTVGAVDAITAARQAVELAKAHTERAMYVMARFEPGERKDGELMHLRTLLAEGRLKLTTQLTTQVTPTPPAIAHDTPETH